MSKIQTTSFTSGELTAEMNKVKEIFLLNMKNQKIIDANQESEMNKFCVVIHEKSAFGKFWDKIWGNPKEDSWSIAIVKILQDVEE